MSNFVNPAIILAASASRSGHSMLANELLAAGRGLRDCKSIRRRITRFKGFHVVSIAQCVETSLLTTGSTSLKRPHIKAI